MSEFSAVNGALLLAYYVAVKIIISPTLWLIVAQVSSLSLHRANWISVRYSNCVLSYITQLMWYCWEDGGLFRPIMSYYPQGQPSSAYLLWGSPAYNKHKTVYVFSLKSLGVGASWNVMAHAQQPDFVFQAKRTSPFKSVRGGGVSSVDCWQPRCAPSAVVMLDTPCSEVVWRVLATHPIPPPSLPHPCVTVNWSLMRRLRVRLAVRLVFHGLTLGTRSHFICIWRCLYWPFVSVQLLLI